MSCRIHPDPHPRLRLKDPKILLPTIIAGLQTYFDRALGANLLYRFERPQYAEIRKKYVTGPTVQVGQEKEMSAIYGAEHFLRMLGTSSWSRHSLPLCMLIVNHLSESTADGCEFLYGRRISGAAERLRERTTAVRMPSAP